MVSFVRVPAASTLRREPPAARRTWRACRRTCRWGTAQHSTAQQSAAQRSAGQHPIRHMLDSQCQMGWDLFCYCTPARPAPAPAPAHIRRCPGWVTKVAVFLVSFLLLRSRRCPSEWSSTVWARSSETSTSSCSGHAGVTVLRALACCCCCCCCCWLCQAAATLSLDSFKCRPGRCQSSLYR